MATKKITDEAPNEGVPDAALEDMTVALNWIQGRLPRVAKAKNADVMKDGKKLYDYDYTTLTDVTEALFPLLSRVGLTWITRPTLAEVGGAFRLVLQYELRHLSGQTEQGVLPLPDRADPQIVGSHITYWRRYALLAVTGLAPGGDDDGQAAKDAAGKGETLDEASQLSLPPQDTEYLIAMLQPDAMTPVADYPIMWQRVVQRRAATKPSPIEHDGQRLTWAQLFGYSLIRRAEACAAPDEVMALWNEAQQVGWGKYPWPWDGQTFQQRLKARGEQIKRDLENKYNIAELAITSASTSDELTVASGLAEALRGRISDDRMVHLQGVLNAQTEAVRASEQATAPTQPADVAVTVPDVATYQAVRHAIFLGKPVPEVSDALLDAHERGELSQENWGQLMDMLHERPEPDGDLYTWLMWQGQMATTEDQLDQVRDQAKVATKDGTFGPDHERAVLATVAQVRIDLRGERYR